MKSVQDGDDTFYTDEHGSEQERYMMHGAPVSIEFIIYMRDKFGIAFPVTGD